MEQKNKTITYLWLLYCILVHDGAGYLLENVLIELQLNSICGDARLCRLLTT